MEGVVYNHLLMDQIFGHIVGIRHLKSKSRVCKVWQNCSEREERHRRNRKSFDHLYYLYPLETTIRADNDINYDDKPFVLNSFDSIFNKLVDYYREEMPLIPEFVVMFNAKLTRPTVWQTAIRLKSYRKYLPPNCRFIHLDSSTIIGTSSHNLIPYPAGERLAGISQLLLSKMNGVDINVFYNQDICRLLKADKNIKCILYFESAKDFDKRDNSGNYIWNSCNHHMWDVMKQLKYELAFGGTRVNAIDVTNGHELSEANMPFACITISGPNVKACSIEFKTGNPQSTEHLLTDFKSRLGFDADDTKNCETFAFAFCRIIPYRFQRYCHFKEGEPSQLIHKIFPKTRFIGAINVMNFGHNYWPGLVSKSDEDSNYRTTHFDSSIIVMINISKRPVD